MIEINGINIKNRIEEMRSMSGKGVLKNPQAFSVLEALERDGLQERIDTIRKALGIPEEDAGSGIDPQAHKQYSH